jgi:hypothetical protein
MGRHEGGGGGNTKNELAVLRKLETDPIFVVPTKHFLCTRALV